MYYKAYADTAHLLQILRNCLDIKDEYYDNFYTYIYFHILQAIEN